LQFQRDKRRARQARIDAAFEQIGDKIIGSALWGPAARERHQERLLVFTIRDSKIVDMQGFTSRRAAERFARRG
jgi:hypothetical protein